MNQLKCNFFKQKVHLNTAQIVLYQSSRICVVLGE